MARVIHLIKSGSGFAMQTACGRTMFTAPMAADWEGFGKYPDLQCSRCAQSKFAERRRSKEQKQ